MSSTNLDKGLDEIIASTGISSNSKSKPRNVRGFKKSRGNTSTKALGKAVAAAAHANGKSPNVEKKNNKKSKPAASKASVSAVILGNPLDTAKRVVVSNLPLDINEQAVKQYFGENVGKIRQVIGSYRGDGTPSGSYTITFDKSGSAKRMYEKFNNQPIDGGKAHISVQILLDPAAAQPNSLQGRIGGAASATPAAPSANATQGKKRRNKRSGANSENKPIKAIETKPEPKKNMNAKKTKAKAQKPQRKTRSTADLDAEMSDYFASAEKNEISV